MAAKKTTSSSTSRKSKTTSAQSKGQPEKGKSAVNGTGKAVTKGKNGEGKKSDTVVNSVSTAAKRIQERERRRKERASARAAAKVEEVEKPSVNNVEVGEPKKALGGKSLTKRELEKFKNLLLELRDRIAGDIEFLTTDNLHRVGRETGADLSGASQHSADHGTDNFDREFALSLATSEQDVLYEVDEALMRIAEGTYGICEMTGVRIEKARLQVIPYTRYSVQAQAQMEQGRAKYRPFAQAFKGW